MDDLYIQSCCLHTITFESTKILRNFRELLTGYFNSKPISECLYLKVLGENGEVIKGKDCYFISFDCSVINLQDEKATKKVLQELLLYHLENNPDILQEYMMFNRHIAEFISQIEIGNNMLSLGFYPTEKTIESFLKSLEISIEYNESEDVPNFILREYLIESLLKMNVSRKEVILLISYPETDVGTKDLQEIIKFLRSINVTTIVITTSLDILTAASIENMFLVNKNGLLYDIVKLKNELESFDIANDYNLSRLSKVLAFHDFRENYFLLDSQMKSFLLSSKL